jgi:hypothetical protein
MFNFMGGLFLGVIIGLGIGLAFMRDNPKGVKKIDDEKYDELMQLLDLAEGENNGA